MKQPHHIGRHPKSFRRLVNKHGDFHVSLEKIKNTQLLKRYVADCFTTLIDIKWRWTILFIVLGFIITWVVFGAVYFFFGLIHGDIKSVLPQNHSPCVDKVFSFATALLFSVESQHTIGYGYRAVTNQCPHVVTAVFLQFILGVGVQCLIAGLFFAKLQRGKKRSETIMFSQVACISKFNGEWYLTIRVGNLRSSQILGVRAMGMLVKTMTQDGDEIPLTQHHINFYTESQSDWINLCWPAIIYHPIDENSPLKNVSQSQALSGYSELIVVLEGVSDSTSKTFQARTSYLLHEVLYEYRFKSMSPILNIENEFQISYLDFDMVLPTNARALIRQDTRDSSSQTEGICSIDIEPIEILRPWRSWGNVYAYDNNIPTINVSDFSTDPMSSPTCFSNGTVSYANAENNNIDMESLKYGDTVDNGELSTDVCVASGGNKMFKITKLTKL